MSRAQLEFYDGLERQLLRGDYPDLQGHTDYLFFYAFELARNAAERGFKYTLHQLLDLAEAYHQVDQLSDTCKHWAFDCLLALEEYEEFLELSEPVEPFGADTHRSNLRLNVQHLLGRDGLGVDLFRMAEGRVSEIARQHPGMFRELLDGCFVEDAKSNGPWLGRIIDKLGVCGPGYIYDLFSRTDAPSAKSGGQIRICCFYAANDFDSRTKRFKWDFNDVIRDCGRKAENLLRDQLGFPRIGEGWVAETALYHTLRDAFAGTDVVHHGRPH